MWGSWKSFCSYKQQAGKRRRTLCGWQYKKPLKKWSRFAGKAACARLPVIVREPKHARAYCRMRSFGAWYSGFGGRRGPQSYGGFTLRTNKPGGGQGFWLASKKASPAFAGEAVFILSDVFQVCGFFRLAVYHYPSAVAAILVGVVHPFIERMVDYRVVGVMAA